MIYSDLSVQDWNELANRSAENKDMVVSLKLVSQKSDEGPYISVFVSSDGSLHFLCEISDNPKEEIVDPNVAGLQLHVLRNYFVLGRERQNYYDIRCTGSHHKEEFTSMVKEICDLIFNRKFEASKAISTVIRRSTSFWGKPKSKILDEQKQLGLFGELYVLNSLQEISDNVVVDKWKGPLQYKNDFYFNTMTIEVKTTLSSRHKHVINGLEQLEPIPGLTLFVASLKLIISEDGESISDYINKIMQFYEDQPDKVEVFKGLLDEYGYDGNHEKYYNKYLLEEISIFPVNENFPVLTTQSLNEPIPSRLSRISYQVDLEGLYSFKVNDNVFKTFLKE